MFVRCCIAAIPAPCLMLVLRWYSVGKYAPVVSPLIPITKLLMIGHQCSPFRVGWLLLSLILINTSKYMYLSHSDIANRISSQHGTVPTSLQAWNLHEGGRLAPELLYPSAEALARYAATRAASSIALLDPPTKPRSFSR